MEKPIEPLSKHISGSKMKPVKDPNLVEIPKPKGKCCQTILRGWSGWKILTLTCQ